MTALIPANHPFPEAHTHRKFGLLMENAKENRDALLAMLKEHPGLARTDGKWTEHFPTNEPWMFAAITQLAPAVLKALLDAGSNPYANNGLNICAPVAVARQSYHPDRIAMLEHLLDKKYVPNPDPHTSLTILNNMIGVMSGDTDPVNEARRRKLYLEVLGRVPLKDNRYNNEHPVYGLAKHSHRLNDSNKIFMLRSMVNEGWTLEKLPASLPMTDMLGTQGIQTLGAAMLAAGLPESTCFEQHGVRRSVGDFLDRGCGLTGGRMRAHAREILNDSLEEMISGRKSHQEILFTPEGKPSWQALGFCEHGMLTDVFFTPAASLFPDSAPVAMAQKLSDALPPYYHTRMNFTRMLREAPFARPDDAATVTYARSTTPIDSGRQA